MARVLSHHSRMAAEDRRPNFINNRARSHNLARLHGRKIVPSDDIFHAPNSIIQTRIGGKLFAGQVTDIITHEQRGVDDVPVFLRVKWFEPLPIEVFDVGVWNIL